MAIPSTATWNVVFTYKAFGPSTERIQISVAIDTEGLWYGEKVVTGASVGCQLSVIIWDALDVSHVFGPFTIPCGSEIVRENLIVRPFDSGYAFGCVPFRC